MLINDDINISTHIFLHKREEMEYAAQMEVASMRYIPRARLSQRAILLDRSKSASFP